MRDTLPKFPHNIECAVVNLDSERGPGTHWVCYVKHGHVVKYFDSFGNLKPPLELIRYLKNARILYNHRRLQIHKDYNCGHLCLEFLINNI